MKIHLYVKQCSHCGLKYFGKTVKDYEKYKGSGHHWLRHIKLHGLNNVETVDVWTFEDQDDASKFALDFSNKNKIVESTEWANLIPEDGRDGNSSDTITYELRQKFVDANTGCKNPSYGRYWWTNGVEEIKSKECPNGWVRGRSKLLKENISDTKKSNKDSSGMKNSSYGKLWWTNGVDSIKSETCPDGYYRGVGSKFRSKCSNKQIT